MTVQEISPLILMIALSVKASQPRSIILAARLDYNTALYDLTSSQHLLISLDFPSGMLHLLDHHEAIALVERHRRQGGGGEGEAGKDGLGMLCAGRRR